MWAWSVSERVEVSDRRVTSGDVGQMKFGKKSVGEDEVRKCFGGFSS